MPQRPLRPPPRRPTLPPRPGIPKPVANAAERLRAGLQEVRELAPGASLLHAVGTRPAQAAALARLLERAAASPVANAPWFASFRTHVEGEIAHDGAQAFLGDLRGRADAQARRATGVIQLGRELAQRFRDPSLRQRFVTEVLVPARRGLLDTQTAWQRTDEIVGRPVLRDASTRTPGWTIGIGATIGGGAVVGAGYATGLCGLRHRAASVYAEGSLACGFLAEADVSLHVQFAPCEPPGFAGCSVGIGASGSYNAGGGVSVAFAPTFVGVQLDAPMLDWTFDSVTVQVSAGVGGDASMSLAYCFVHPLRLSPPA